MTEKFGDLLVVFKGADNKHAARGNEEELRGLMSSEQFRKENEGWIAVLYKEADHQDIVYESLRDKAAKLLAAQGWTESDVEQALCTCGAEDNTKASTEPTRPPGSDAEAGGEPEETPVSASEEAAEIPANWETLNAQDLRKLSRKATKQNTSRWNKEACLHAIRKKVFGSTASPESGATVEPKTEDPALPVPIPPPAMPSVGPGGPPPPQADPQPMPAPVVTGIPAPPPPPME